MPSSATPSIYTLSLHDALPISTAACSFQRRFPAIRKERCWIVTSGTCPFLQPRFWPAEPTPSRRSCLNPNRTWFSIRVTTLDSWRSEEHTSELQSPMYLVCRLLRHPVSTLFPYTTLFRSQRQLARFSGDSQRYGRSDAGS